MPRHPTLQECYRALAVAGEGVVLLSDEGEAVLRGAIYEQVIPLLDGRRSADEIAELLAPEQLPAEVYYALGQLEARGHLAHRAGSWTTESPAAAPAAGAPQRVALRTVGDVPHAACRAALASLGWTVDGAAATTLVLTDSYLRPELAEVNARALGEGRAWVLARIAGPAPWIGPLMRPGETCCWRCLADRARRNRPLEHRLLGGGGARVLAGTVAAHAALHVVALGLARATADQLAGTITVLDPRGRAHRREHVARRPQCPACGDAGLYTRWAAATGGRTVPRRTPADEPMPLDSLVAPLTGVVHDVRPLAADLGDLLHVGVARYGDGGARGDVALLDRELRQASGKGRTPAAARQSALGEAIERYSAVVQGDEPVVRSSLAELGDVAIAPNDLMQFSATQYAQRESGNRSAGRFQWVPRPFEPREPLDWTPIASLASAAIRYVPTALLYAGHRDAGQDGCCTWDSSGTAAGASWDEAVLRGVLELVERDSLAIWWYNRLPRPGVELDTVGDPWCARLVEHLRARGREIWALDLTTDLGVPCFAAASRRTGAGPDAIVFGFGADLDARIALQRALAELGQVLLHVTEARHTGRALDPALAAWLSDATCATDAYVAPGSQPPSRLNTFPCRASHDPADDVGTCVRLLARHGLEPFVLDQTRPDIGVPVAKVVVPGLRHFRARFAPGRLYTVPVAMGWLSGQHPESELNPVAFFL